MTSVRAALGASRRRGQIVVVADCCSDRTTELAREALGDDGEVLVSRAGNPGMARRLGVSHILSQDPGDPATMWLATTDADGTVPADWLCTQLDLADTGAVAVAGIVVLDEGADPTLAGRHRAVYTLHPDGTHPHVHGANLGVRADAYLDVGGWSDDPAVGEDQRMWTQLRDRGWPVSASSSSWVTTSSRTVGRVDGGFATDLLDLSAGHEPRGPRATTHISSSAPAGVS